MLLQLSWFFPLSPPSPSTPLSLRQSPHHNSCPWVTCTSSLATPFPILYCTSPWLSCNYLFVLFNPLTSSPFPPHPPAIWQPSKCSPDPWFCLWTCLLSLFLDSIVDRYVFMAILLFIVLIFFFSQISPFNISNNNWVIVNSFSFFLSGKLFYLPFNSKW